MDLETTRLLLPQTVNDASLSPRDLHPVLSGNSGAMLLYTRTDDADRPRTGNLLAENQAIC